MKKFLIFIGGFVAGILATILVAYVINFANEPYDDGFPGLTLFPEKGECITTEYDDLSYDIRSGRNVISVVNEIKVMQVLAPNVALATTGKFNNLLVLLINYDGISYFDDQKIQIPANKCARQIGTYQYTSKDERHRTIPAVVIDEK